MPTLSERRSGRRRTDHGFTLIEITLVLLIVAMLTTMVAVSFASATRAARVSDAIDKLRLSDALGREQAVRFDRPVIWNVTLPSGPVSIEKLRIAGQPVQSPRTTIECSPLGHTPSYAILLSDLSGDRRWLVVAGLTGLTSTTTNDADVASVFAEIESNKIDLPAIESIGSDSSGIKMPSIKSPRTKSLGHDTD